MTDNQTDVAGAQARNPPTDIIGYLSASALGAELTADELSTLAKNVELRKLSKDEILISEAELDDRLYAVAQGKFAVLRSSARGQENLGTLGPGMIIGELAFLDGLKRTATIKAENDECCVIALRRKELESLISNHPLLVYKVMRAIVRSAHSTVGKMDAAYSDLLHYISG